MNLPVRKMLVLIAAIALTAATGSAQLVNVESIKKVDVPKGTLVNTATISPDGTYVVISDVAHAGLATFDFATKKTAVISTKASGFGVRITPDSREVIYREYSTDADHLRWATLKSKDVQTKKEQTLVARTRDLNGVTLQGARVNIVEGKRTLTKNLRGTASAGAEVAVSIVNGQLCVSQNGKMRIISPQGTRDASYLWPELSPDGKHICYYHSDTGTYVCDLNGKNVKPLGRLHAAKWLDNSTVVAMRDRDNGYVITASEIVAKNISNLREQVLTPKGVVATYPTASAKRISFVTPKGELYLINLK